MLSIVICTYNRSKYLTWALESVCPQVVGHGDVEVMVVDNNSVDDTRKVVEGFAERYGFVRYVFEENQGLSYARNRGWKEARGEYVGYLDDDGKAGLHWVGNALKIIAEYSPDLMGGPYYPYYEDGKPDWYLDRFGTREMHERDGFIDTCPQLSGGNMFWRRELLDRMGGFDPAFGMTGKTLHYGEETVLQEKMFKQYPGLKAYYSSALNILHLVLPEKMTFGWRVRQILARGRYRVLRKKVKHLSLFDFLFEGLFCFISLLMVARRCCWALLKRDKVRHPFWLTYVYDYGLKPLASIGRVKGMVELMRSKRE